MTSRSQAFLAAVASARSWTDIQTGWGVLSEKEKGDRFEDLTKAYLQLAPEYVSKLKHVWLWDEVPAEVRKKLKLPGKDEGIDLVAETHAGEYWSIQSKYRQATNQSLTHRELSTFTSLTFSICKGFSFALVCTTTERTSSLYRQADNIGFCNLETWQELDAEFFDKLRDKLTSKPTKRNPRQPRPHQQNAVQDGLEHFGQGQQRGKLIMPCGTGKSLTAWFLAQSLGSKRIVIAVPSLSLIKQTLKVWSREAVENDLKADWICVCSDETAGKADQDDIVVQRQDIAVPCYTDTNAIAQWLNAPHEGLKVVFTTYQSGDVLATAARKAKFTFDLGIMDEAHKTVGDGDKQFSILLHDHNIEIAKRIFMTATERRYKGSSDKVLSMDDPDIYGDTFHQLSFKQAMECQPPILCDYNVITIGVNRDEIKDLIKRNVFVRPAEGKWDEEMEADMLAAMVALRKAMKEHPIKHAVSFHGSIQRAELFQRHNDVFTQEFPEFGELATFHVSGETPTGTRSNIIKTFAQADRSLVTNARCLTEGVDVPGIDCVLFADPRKSTVDIVQAVGRALRLSEGKKLGYVILPVLHESDATSEQIVESKAFKQVLETLSDLATNDDRIIDYFRGISQGQSRGDSGRVSFEWDERLTQTIDVAKLVQELEIKCWGRLAKISWRPFEEAREYARSLNLIDNLEWKRHCRKGPKFHPQDIPYYPDQTYAKKGWVSWGDWLGTGRISYRKRNLMDFKLAREFVHGLKLKNQKEWTDFCKGLLPDKGNLPQDIPATPWAAYKNKGWISTGDWLGTANVAHRLKRWENFNKARAFARSLKLKNWSEWEKYCKGLRRDLPSKPDNIPTYANATYENEGWISVGDWLGTESISPREREYMPFKEARAFVHKLKLRGYVEWKAYCAGKLPKKIRRPKNIPSNPNVVYANSGWISMSDWVGNGFVSQRKRHYRDFEVAKKFVHSLRLKTAGDWRNYCAGKIKAKPSLPNDIPSRAEKIYEGKGWINWSDWLGLLDFKVARKIVQSLKLRNRDEWIKFCKGELNHKQKLSYNIPEYPWNSYKDSGWVSMDDWLGIS
jgi:superfamily II DNA or RNA helicase